ncbi:MAG: APC family permease, partial [Chloroflexota bacterium]|nr:APC family permease [Chloroflexota bacterium]
TAVLLVLAIIILVNKGGSLSAAPFAPPSSATGGLTGIATGFALAIYSFVGWEASAPLGEETDNPKRNVPIALVTAVIVLAAIYVFVTYAVSIAYGVNHPKTLAADLNPFSTLARIYFGPLRGLVDIAGITSICASTLALSNTQGRILFHGGRAGIFPSVLGKISDRFKTPYIALMTYMTMVIVAVLVTMAWLGSAKLANDPFTIYGVLGTFGTLPLIIIYGLTNVALIVYTVRHRPQQMNPVTHYLLPAIGVIVMLAPAWDFFQTSAPPFDRVAEITLLLFAFALVYGLIIARTKPAAAERVGTALAGYEKVEGVAV